MSTGGQGPRIDAMLLPELPPLAWCLVVERGSACVRLYHGAGVETGPEGFSEGAWAGPFSLEGLMSARYVAGSGAVVGAEIRVRSSTHTLERLFAVEAPGVLFVSNSLAFVLARSGSALDPEYPHYEADLLSFLRGPLRIRSTMPLASGRRLRQFCWQSLTIRPDLRIERDPLPSVPAFPDFARYRAHLVTLSEAIVGNAAAVSRRERYRPVALVSRGYDSPACAVIARECGAREAVTFVEARRDFSARDDDGTEIAQTLAMEVVAHDRAEYRAGDGTNEAVFLASGGGGEDVVLAAVTRQIRRGVVFTGFLGDTMWGVKGVPAFSEQGRITYPGGGSIGEFRLRADFVHLPLPMMDLRSHRSVLQISRSAEMKPWRLGVEYDRPIPRRIAEEAGIARDAFGQAKRAVTEPPYYDERALGEYLGAEAEASFSAYMDAHAGHFRTGLDGFAARSARAIRYVRYRVTWRASRAGLASVVRWTEPRLDERWRRQGVGLLLLPWSVERISAGYRDVLVGAGVVAADASRHLD